MDLSPNEAGIWMDMKGKGGAGVEVEERRRGGRVAEGRCESFYGRHARVVMLLEEAMMRSGHRD
jgi:hypothetical protein